MAIEHDVEIVVLLGSAMKTVGQRAGSPRQVRAAYSPEPLDIITPEERSAKRRMIPAKRDHRLEEAENVTVCFEPAPVEPGLRAIDVVWVRIAFLRLKKFVSRPEHRRAVRQEQQAAEVFYLLLAQFHGPV